VPGRNLFLIAGWGSYVQIGSPEWTTYGGRLVIPGGNVSIGTTNPAGSTLRVNGSLRVDGLGERNTVANFVGLTAGNTYTIPAGTYFVALYGGTDGVGRVEVNTSIGWHYFLYVNPGQDEKVNGCMLFSDGANVRVYCASGTLYYTVVSIN